MLFDGETFDSLLVERLERIVRITLNRPDRRNAITRGMRRELVDVVERCAADAGVNAIVIRGAGKSFCSGYDIGPSTGAEHGQPDKGISLPARAMATLDIGRDWSRIWDAPLPVIAQVHGHCLAGGTDLAMHCDLVVAAEDAIIGFPALRMGGTPPTNMWLYNVGPQWAKRLLYTGDTFTGRFAEKIGFALQAVPAEQLDGHVLALANRIAAMGREIVAVNKHVLNRGIDLMGRAILQQVAAPMDSIANQATEMGAFMERASEIGLAEACKERDAPFSEGLPLDCQN